MELEVRHKPLNWQLPLFEPHRYKVVYGGRGSGKSYAIADILLITSLQRKCIIICGREFQNSIKDSVHSLLKQRIEALGLSDFFEVTREEIKSDFMCSRFIFKGLRNNIDSIKSMAGITHMWIEEADTLSAESWKVIKPTIREENSEIWITMNPKNKTDILYREFIEPEQVPANTYRVKVNWQDNPHFPSVLKDEMERDKQRDYGYYRHVWEGECLEHSDAQIFKNRWEMIKEKDYIEPDDVHPYYGLDYGFSQSPTAGIRCYVHDNKLYISHEAVKKELDLDDTTEFLEKHLPDLRKYTIYADSARPDNISFMKRRGLSIKGVEKGKGSIEDGIDYIKTFDRIIVHERCRHTMEELTLYSFKVDERSGDITNKIVDEHNHCLAGDTLIDTTKGQFKIRDLVNKTGEVYSITDSGQIVCNKYFNVRLTQKNAPLFEIKLSNGKSISCTREHFFLTSKSGWQPLFNIKEGDQLVVLNNILKIKEKNKKLCQNMYFLMVLNLPEMIKLSITSILRDVRDYIGMCGSFLKVIYQRIMKFITKTITNLITTFQTLFVCHQVVIGNTTVKILAKKQGQNFKPTFTKLDPLQLNGINLNKVAVGIKNIGKNIQSLLLKRKFCNNVGNVAKTMKLPRSVLKRESFVATLVSLLSEEKRVWMTFKNNVLYVEKNLHQINTLKSRHVASIVDQPCLTVTEIKPKGYQDVYNLEVKNDHNYTIEGGIVTHNCIDALRYALERSMKSSRQPSAEQLRQARMNQRMYYQQNF